MPYGVPLINLRRQLRLECGQTPNPAQMVQAQEMYDAQLNRQQRELWDAYDWPHLDYWVDLSVDTGEALLTYPPTMPLDQINSIYWAGEGETSWKKLDYGIRAFDVKPGATELGTPSRWSNYAVVTPEGLLDGIGLLQILPSASGKGTLRLEGQAPIVDMVADSDVCVLDSDLICLFAAAQVMATQKAEVAAMILEKARGHLRKLQLNNAGEKRRNYSMGGSYGSSRSRASAGGVPYIDYMP